MVGNLKIIVVVCFAMHSLCQEVTSNTSTSLCFINADHNDLTQLPAEIGNLSNLAFLYLGELKLK